MFHFKKQSKLVSCLLTIAMVFILCPGAAWAANPFIKSSIVFDNNSGIRVDFSEGVWGNAEHNSPVTADDFTLTFNKNGGTATGVTINALKSSTGNNLIGGEESITFSFTTTGVPNGKETIEIKVKDGASVFNSTGEPMADIQTTGVKNLYDKLPPDFVTGYPKAGAVQEAGSKQAEILIKAYESVTAYYVVIASGSALPSAQQVKLGKDAADTPALASGQNISLTAHEEESIIAGPLPASKTPYDAYLIIEDVNNNTMKTPKIVTVTTPDGPVEVSSITVTGTENADTMKSYRDGGSLQMFAAVLPEDAANKSVTWSVTGKGNSWLKAEPGEIGAGFAYIDPNTGLMNQGTVGLVTIKAAAKDGSGVFGEKDITITGVNMSSSISTLAGKTHTLTATPVPALEASQKLTWASNNEAAVTVDQDGNITAVGLGSADITATTPDGRQGIASVTVDRSPANYITAFGFPQQTEAASIDGISGVKIKVAEETDISKLSATFTISPKASVTVNGTAQVSGVTVNDFTHPVIYKVTAENGDVRDWAVTVSKPYVAVSSITVTAAGGVSKVVTGKTLQLSATVLPANANDKTFTWSVENGTGTAAVSDAGLLTAIKAGTVTVKATANDDADIVGTRVITITGSSSPGGGGGSSAISKPPTELPEPEKPVVPEPKPQEITLNDISGHWAEAAIKSLVVSGAINGYPDGSFKPEQTITQAEFAAMLVKVFQLPAGNGKIFDDTDGHWAQDAISAAYAAGIISGYNDSSFGPDDPVTREQIAVMIVKAQGLSDLSTSLDFTDSDKISSWARDGVAAAAAQQLIAGYPDKSFQPARTATRAEAVSILVRALSTGKISPSN